MKILKVVSGLTWVWLSFLLTITFYDYQKDQLTWENLTFLIPLNVLVAIDLVEYKRRRKNVNNDWSRRL